MPDSFILFPSITTGFGYTTNGSNAAGGTPTLVLHSVTPELLIQSNWARHSGTLTLRGNYEQFLDGSSGNPSGSAEGTLHLDLPGEWSSDLAAGYQYQQQAISDPNFPAGADSPPGVHTLTGSAGLNSRVGDLGFTVEGNIARTIYEDATSGGVAGRSGRPHQHRLWRPRSRRLRERRGDDALCRGRAARRHTIGRWTTMALALRH